ncbi:hypothetical protein R3P38DRAFT_3559890 [Favolaschia claudopus]|uniref:Uncharacterized protein n=1 Tax=Favolaschia claudopus TaxID=2862362 RepID=A0AAW0AXC3_9AGAR
MISSLRLFTLAALLISTQAATTPTITPPGHKGLPNQPIADIAHPTTDNAAIVQAVTEVDQKTAPPIDAEPDINIAPTIVTAIDGTITNSTVDAVAPPTDQSGSRKKRGRNFGRRAAPKFEKIFDGLPQGQHDASVEGTAYLTYTVVNNATYNVQACLDWCAGINGCEKTNFGGQASYPQVGNEAVPLTFITQSSGWGLNTLVDPDTPDGYDLVGQFKGANNAPGYMGFSFLDKYDVNACAQLCNGRGVDPNGGGCAYFNIWRAVVDGTPTTYTCSMYYLVADPSTAVNFGQGNLVVTLSRGYARKDLLPDGGFEGYTDCDEFCLTESYTNWIGTSPSGGSYDASIFYFEAYAHTGHGSALLGAAFDEDADIGTLSPAQPIKTESGASYVIQCFMASAFSGQQLEAGAKVDIMWNGQRVGGVSGFQEYAFVQASAVGTGSDKLAFVGGSAPAWTFIDDCHIYKA